MGSGRRARGDRQPVGIGRATADRRRWDRLTVPAGPDRLAAGVKTAGPTRGNHPASAAGFARFKHGLEDGLQYPQMLARGLV